MMADLLRSYGFTRRVRHAVAKTELLPVIEGRGSRTGRQGEWDVNDVALLRRPTGSDPSTLTPVTEIGQSGGQSVYMPSHHVPIRAAFVGADEYARRRSHLWGGSSSTRPKTQEWETKVRNWQRGGPGFVGAMTAMYGNLISANGELIMQELAGRDDHGRTTWKEASDERAWHVLQMWRGIDSSQADLLGETIRHLDAVGQLFQALHRTDGRMGTWYYTLHAHHATELNHDAHQAIFKNRPDLREGDFGCAIVDDRLVEHIFTPDEVWKGEPTSHMRRLVGAIEGFILADRSLDADLLSRLGGNSIVWKEAVEGGKDWGPDFARWAQSGYEGIMDDEYSPMRMKDRLAQFAPYLMIAAGEPPVKLDLGRDVGRQMEVRNARWRDICIGADAPTNALDEGAGSESRWGGYLLRDETALGAVAPRMQRVCAAIQGCHAIPWGRYLSLDLDWSRLRVWYRPPEIRPDRSDSVIRIASTGVPNRKALARAAGLDSTEIIELPPGLSEADWHMLNTQGMTVAQMIEAGGKKAEGPAMRQAPTAPGIANGAPALIAPGVRVPAEPKRPDSGREGSTQDAVLAALGEDDGELA